MFYFVLPHPVMPSHYDYGYEDKFEFFKAVRRLSREYGGRIGECIATRHTFLLLRFFDMPDGVPTQAWIPGFMLERTAPPSGDDYNDADDTMDGVYGDGW